MKSTIQAEEAEFRARLYASEEEKRRRREQSYLRRYNEERAQRRQREAEAVRQRDAEDEERSRARCQLMRDRAAAHRFAEHIESLHRVAQQQAWFIAHVQGRTVSAMVLLRYDLVLSIESYWARLGSSIFNDVVGH